MFHLMDEKEEKEFPLLLLLLLLKLWKFLLLLVKFVFFLMYFVDGFMVKYFLITIIFFIGVEGGKWMGKIRRRK